MMTGMATVRKPSLMRRILPVTLIVLGCLLATYQFVLNLHSYIEPLFLQIIHPPAYRFDHYDKLLKRCVRGRLVDYQQLKGDPALDQAVDEIAHIKTDRMVNDREVMTFWLNTYNLLILKLVVDHYPLTNMAPLEEQIGFTKFVVGGEPLSIKEIEEKCLHPLLLDEKRALFLMCGGASGYPKLTDHVLEPACMESDLNQAVSQFVSDPANVYFDPVMDSFQLSPWFRWNRSIFGNQPSSPFAFANAFLTPSKQANLTDKHLKMIYAKNFDWRLNDTNMNAPIGAATHGNSSGLESTLPCGQQNTARLSASGGKP